MKIKTQAGSQYKKQTKHWWFLAAQLRKDVPCRYFLAC